MPPQTAFNNIQVIHSVALVKMHIKLTWLNLFNRKRNSNSLCAFCDFICSYFPTILVTPFSVQSLIELSHCMQTASLKNSAFAVIKRLEITLSVVEALLKVSHTFSFQDPKGK